MRLRLVLALVALLAMVAIPAEALRQERVGSAVDQVASCLEASASARDTLGHEAVNASCDPVQKPGPVMPALAALALLGLLVLAGRIRRGGLTTARTGEQWRLPDGGWRTTASWRGPPLAA